MATTKAKKPRTKKPKADDLPHPLAVKIEYQLKQVYLRESQATYSEKIQNNDITICHGPAGTSKTFTACYTALKLFAANKIKKIILVKPIQESGERLGFLPGSMEDKIDPYIESYRSNFDKILRDPAIRAQLESEKVIEYKPLAYMRGATYDHSLMILDEAQNADYKQLMLFITRMGKLSKVLITGDVSQYDIEKNRVSLPNFIGMLNGVEGLVLHTFGDEDQTRNKILIEITRRYDKWRVDNHK